MDCIMINWKPMLTYISMYSKKLGSQFWWNLYCQSVCLRVRAEKSNKIPTLEHNVLVEIEENAMQPLKRYCSPNPTINSKTNYKSEFSRFVLTIWTDCPSSVFTFCYCFCRQIQSDMVKKISVQFNIQKFWNLFLNPVINTSYICK